MMKSQKRRIAFFEKRYGKGGFRRFLDRISAPHFRTNEVAKAMSMPRGCVYYFAQRFGIDYPALRKSQKGTVQQMRWAAFRERFLKKSPLLQEVKDRCAAHGLQFELVGSAYYLKERQVLVNKHLARIRTSRTKRKTTGGKDQRYFLFRLSDSKAVKSPFYIFVCLSNGEKGRYFVVPTAMLKRRKYALFPKNYGKTRLSRSQWREYSEAWNLLN